MAKYLIMIFGLFLVFCTPATQALEINVREAPLQETVLALSKTHQLDVLGIETLEGRVTAHIHGASGIDMLAALAKQQGFSLKKEDGYIVVDGRGMKAKDTHYKTLILQPQFVRPEEVKEALGAVLDTKRIGILSDSNRVLVRCSSQEEQLIQSVWKELDVEPQQVHLETSVIAFESSYAKEVGFNWSWLSLTGSGEDGSHSYGAIQFGRTPSGDAYKFFVKPELSAMESSGKAVLIARPSIMAMNGEEAKILIGDRVPVLEESRDDGERTSHIRYEDVGIKLVVTPFISQDGAVDVSLQAEVSSPLMVSELKAYKISAREAKTRVRLQPGETLVIGGLMDNREGRQYKKIPFLGDIPLLGKLFKHSKKTKDSVEMVMLLRAIVTKQGDHNRSMVLNHMSPSMKEMIHGMEEAKE